MKRASALCVASSQLTFKSLFDLYMTENVIPLGKRQDNFQYFYNKHGSKWADVLIADISKLDVLQWRNQTARESGAPGAQRALDTMSAIINWAMKHEIVEIQKNPCKFIDRLKCEPRDRFLSLEELENLDRALSDESALFEDFFLICLLTGARRGNVLAMRWEHLDLESSLWHIPAEQLKGRKSQPIVLTDAAVNLLNQRKAESVLGTPWVFPSPKINDHLKDPRPAWKRVCTKAGLADARIHDLRRTMGSYMAIQGESAYIIGKMLGHRDQRSTAVYARLDLAPVRSAAEAVNQKWQKRIAMPSDSQPRVPKVVQFEQQVPPVVDNHQAVVVCRAIDPVDRIIAEGKILAAMRGGACTRKGIYRKFSGRERLHTGELGQILEGLIARGLVAAYQNDLSSNHWRYRLAHWSERKSEAGDALSKSFRYTRVKQAPAPLNRMFVEQKILQSIREGKNTKSQFWWKFDGRTRLKKTDLDSIIKDMIERELIAPFRSREGSKVIAYQICEQSELKAGR